VELIGKDKENFRLVENRLNSVTVNSHQLSSILDPGLFKQGSSGMGTRDKSLEFYTFKIIKNYCF
jgi:hypothetical protein